ncbi:hypothetical protein J6590_087673 [Homalodisca vitripennis]|nr:hypothetical protein J6590_087673 [Homalodisca vitripennis]
MFPRRKYISRVREHDTKPISPHLKRKNVETEFYLPSFHSTIYTTISAETSPIVESSFVLCACISSSSGNTHFEVNRAFSSSEGSPKAAKPRQELTQIEVLYPWPRFIEAFRSLMIRKFQRPSLPSFHLCYQTFMVCLIVVPTFLFVPARRQGK